MGLLSGIFGQASTVDPEKLNKDFGPLLAQGETIEVGFQVIRDMFVFTNKRLILVDKQGITGSKVEVVTVPYRSIDYFSKISAGLLDLDSELIIWVKGMDKPIKKTFGRNDNINVIFQILSNHVL